MPETLAEATAAAEAEQARYLDVQHRALHGEPEDRPDAPEVLAAAKEAELAQARVEVARRREQDAREAARVEAMHAIGTRAVQLAAAAGTPSTELVAEVRQLAELAASIRTRSGAHDAEVVNLYDEAAGLYGDSRADPVGRLGQKGPWAPHTPPLGIKYGNTSVHIVGGSADLAIAAAIKGDVDGALKLLTPVKDHTPPKPAAVYKDTYGQFGMMPVYGNGPDRSLRTMIADGRAVALTPGEMDDWMAGYWQRDPA